MKKNQIFLVDFDHTLYDVSKGILYPDAKSFVIYLRKFGIPYLFSEGEINFQNEKLEKTKMKSLFGENIKLFPSFSKMEYIKKFVNDDLVILIDDKPEIIDEAINQGFKTVRLKRGRYQEIKTIKNPDLEVESLNEIIKNNLIDKL